MHSFAGNRVVRDTGAAFPIFNAPIGYFARGRLAGAVAAAGGVGLMETSSQPLEGVAAEFEIARAMSERPIGLQMFLRVLKQILRPGCGPGPASTGAPASWPVASATRPR